MYRIVILGSNGQVGQALTALAKRDRLPHVALGRGDCDIHRADSLTARISRNDFVVNCAAYTAVDKAETEVEQAYATNCVAVEKLASVCRVAGAPLMHLSTDYVFNGKHVGAASEHDSPSPQNVYGRSKLGGEMAIRAVVDRHLILRTSWVFSDKGSNFVKTIRRLGEQRKELRVVADQVGGPTAAHDIACAVLKMVERSRHREFESWGTYHFSGVPAVSWYEFARIILADKKVDVVPIRTAEYPTPARRPLNSVLDCSRIQHVFRIQQPDWKLSLYDVLRRIDLIGAS